MNMTTTQTMIPDLHKLHTVPLTPLTQQCLDRVLANNGGEPSWRARKAAEMRQLAALAQLAPHRVEILEADLQTSLRVVLRMHVPVPCRPDADGHLVVMPEAVLGLDYRQEAVRQPMPGYAFVTVLAPHPVWLANCHLPEQALCLGTTLPASIRVRALVQMAYAALSMSTFQIDPRDSAGVMNAEAAAWWQQNLHLAPLSKTPFLQSA